MTWNQLARQIEQLTPAQRRQPVRYVEPYDEAAEGLELTLTRAGRDVYIQPDPAEPERLFVRKGSPILT